MSKISFVILISVLFSSGCSTVKPWQRGYLAEDVMSASADPLRSSLDNHIYFSKEGSSGGGQSAGGGCGCK